MRLRERTRRWDVPRTAVAVVAGVWLLRLLGSPWATGFAPTFPDSASYLRVSSVGPFSTRFWFGERPPTYPLLLWMLGNEIRLVVVVQSMAYIGAFIWLAAVIWARIVSRPIAVVAVTVLALIAMEARWAMWNTLILTESLSISLSVAGMAAWWQFIAEPNRRRITVATVLTVAWMLLRDSNAVTFGVAAIGALAIAVVLNRRSPNDIRLWSIFGLTIVVASFALSAVGQLSSDRGETSFHNNVGLRWLEDDEMTEYFRSHGMPINDALLARRGGDAWRDGGAFLNDPALTEYRDWADGPGRVVFARSLIEKSDWWAGLFVDDMRVAVRTDYASYDDFDVQRRLPDRMLGPFDPVGALAVMMLLSVGSVAAGVVAWRRRHALGWLTALLVVSVWSDVYLSLVADAIEIMRHLMAPLLRFAVVTVIAFAIGADSLVQRRGER